MLVVPINAVLASSVIETTSPAFHALDQAAFDHSASVPAVDSSSWIHRADNTKYGVNRCDNAWGWDAITNDCVDSLDSMDGQRRT